MILFKNVKNNIENSKKRRTWRKNNSHNQTWIENVKDPKCISVGNMTWGGINIIDFLPVGSEQCHISIGSYCSLAGKVSFMRGGEHRIDRISTFLYKSCFKLGIEENLKNSKNIVVGDDVWIGYDCLILPGSNIGQGAIIGAGSVVRGEVPPYSVYIFDRTVKKRFSDDLICELQKIDYSKLERDQIEEAIDILYSEPTVEKVREFVDIIRKK